VGSRESRAISILKYATRASGSGALAGAEEGAGEVAKGAGIAAYYEAV
jgi:hypothetical protein